MTFEELQNDLDELQRLLDQAKARLAARAAEQDDFQCDLLRPRPTRVIFQTLTYSDRKAS